MLWFIGSQRVGHDCATELKLTNGVGCCDLSFFFLIFSLKPPLRLPFFTLIKRLLNSSLLSANKVLSTYLRLLMFLPLILLITYPA